MASWHAANLAVLAAHLPPRACRDSLVPTLTRAGRSSDRTCHGRWLAEPHGFRAGWEAADHRPVRGTAAVAHAVPVPERQRGRVRRDWLGSRGGAAIIGAVPALPTCRAPLPSDVSSWSPGVGSGFTLAVWRFLPMIRRTHRTRRQEKALLYRRCAFHRTAARLPCPPPPFRPLYTTACRALTLDIMIPLSRVATHSISIVQSGASLVRYNIPTSCNRAEHECRRVDECNGRKWQAIPSCKK